MPWSLGARASATLAAVVLAGCSGSQVGGEERPAPWIATELSWTEPTPIDDVTGEQAWASIAGAKAAVLTYSDGTSTDLTVEATSTQQRVRYARQVSLEEAERADPDARIEDTALGFGVGEALVFDVTLGFATADGGFSESWADLLVLPRDEAARLDHQFTAGEMQGSHQLPPADFARVELQFLGGGESASGKLEAVQSPECGSDQPCPPPERETFATFGPP